MWLCYHRESCTRKSVIILINFCDHALVVIGEVIVLSEHVSFIEKWKTMLAQNKTCWRSTCGLLKSIWFIETKKLNLVFMISRKCLCFLGKLIKSTGKGTSLTAGQEPMFVLVLAVAQNVVWYTTSICALYSCNTCICNCLFILRKKQTCAAMQVMMVMLVMQVMLDDDDDDAGHASDVG